MTPNQTVSSYRLTRHAAARIQQRGIKREVLEYLLMYGTHERRARSGCMTLSMGTEDSIDGVPNRILDQARQLMIVVGPKDEIVTVYWDRNKKSVGRLVRGEQKEVRWAN